jgi:hypothetical protein
MGYADDQAPMQGQTTRGPMGEGKQYRNGVWVDTLARDPATGELSTTGENAFKQDGERYTGLADAAQNRGAYQMNWEAANADRQQSIEARNMHSDAMGMAQAAAMGRYPSIAQQSGQRQLQQGLLGQQAVAGSMRGGSLARAAAMRQQQQGAGAYMQAGNQQLSAQRAQEMAQARGEYMDMSSAQRKQDQAAQGLAEQQAQAQQKSELGQRNLNDQEQLYNEGRYNDMQQEALTDQSHQNALDAQAGQRHEEKVAADDARFMKRLTGVASMGMTAAAGVSDERAKQNVVPLYEDAGSGIERHWDADVSKAKSAPDVTSGASLSGPTPRYSLAKAAESRQAAPAKPKAERKLSDAELMRMVAEMQGTTAAQRTQLAHGPSTLAAARRDPMGDALADGLAPHKYEYKPAFRGAEGQQAGETNVGPMAQNMAANPVTATAVKRGPNGLLYIDQAKATKLNSAGLGHVAAKQREMEAEIAALKGRA